MPDLSGAAVREPAVAVAVHVHVNVHDGKRETDGRLIDARVVDVDVVGDGDGDGCF